MSFQSTAKQWLRSFLGVSLAMLGAFAAIWIVVVIVTLPLQVWSLLEQGAFVTDPSDGRPAPDWMIYAIAAWLFFIAASLWATILTVDPEVSDG